MIVYNNTPTYDPVKVFVHPTTVDKGYYLHPPHEDDNLIPLVDEHGYPTAKALGLFYFDLNTKEKQGLEISLLRWTRWGIQNSVSGEIEDIFDGDIIKIVWSDGLTSIPRTYKMKYFDINEGRWCLLEITPSPSPEYIAVGELHLVNKDIKSIQKLGNIVEGVDDRRITPIILE